MCVCVCTPCVWEPGRAELPLAKSAHACNVPFKSHHSSLSAPSSSRYSCPTPAHTPRRPSMHVLLSFHINAGPLSCTRRLTLLRYACTITHTHRHCSTPATLCFMLPRVCMHWSCHRSVVGLEEPGFHFQPEHLCLAAALWASRPCRFCSECVCLCLCRGCRTPLCMTCRHQVAHMCMCVQGNGEAAYAPPPPPYQPLFTHMAHTYIQPQSKNQLLTHSHTQVEGVKWAMFATFALTFFVCRVAMAPYSIMWPAVSRSLGILPNE